MKSWWVVWAVFKRSWLNVARRPVVLLLSFVQPLVWMTFFGFLFHRFGLDQLEGKLSYIDFLMPGVCGLTVLLGASQSGISFIRDMQTDFFTRLVATPAGRHWLLTGKVAADVSRLLVQAAVVCLLGMLLGVRVDPAVVPMILALIYLALFGVAYACLSSYIALKTRSQETMAAFVHIVNMPVFFSSTALVPLKQMPAWLTTIAQWNPLSLVVNALREAVLFGSSSPILVTVAPLIFLAAVFFLLASRAMNHASHGVG